MLLIDQDSSDVEAYPDLASLARAIEGIDVLEGNFMAFDSSGRVIELRAEGVKRRGRVIDVGQSIATPSDPPRLDREVLAKALVANLQGGGVEGVQGLSLEELLWRVLVRLDWPAEAMP